MLNKKQKNNQSQLVHSKQTVEYAQFQTLRFASLLLYALLCVGSIGALWFLYTRTYQTIGQVEALNALGTVVAEERVDMKAYDTVIALHTKRNAKVYTPFERNPFVILGEKIDNEVATQEESETTTTTTSVSTTINLQNQETADMIDTNNSEVQPSL